MNNLTSSTANTYTGGNTSGAWHGVPCGIHGWQPCSCNANATAGPFQLQYKCPSCGMLVQTGSSFHSCSGTAATGFVMCSICGQSYTGSGMHYCSGLGTTTIPTFLPGTNMTVSSFKEVKEITTDNELIYEWNGISFDMHLPAKFSDCFLKVGYSWSPLYPLIFSAFENDSKEMSFHLVTAILGKTFDGDDVILKSVTSVKIEDNLTLLQLTQRVRDFFKEDDKTNSPV